MKLNKYKLFSFGILLGVLFGGFLLFGYAAAQVDTGLEPVGEALGQEAVDIRVIVANIIKIALGLLGIVALVLMLYGGFVWMTAAGNEDKIAQAKKILVNAVIGLVIILSAYAIVSFIINKLIEVTSPPYPEHCYNGVQDEGEEGVDCGGECASCGGVIPPGAENIFYVQQKPSGDVCVRNFYAIIVFNRPVNLSSIAGNLVIRRVSDQVTASGTWQFLSDATQNAIKFAPGGDCGDGTSDCLDANTQYELVFVSSDSIQSQDNLSLSCSMGVGCNTTNFTTGDGVDRTPPVITIDYPEEGERLERGLDVSVDVSFTDDNGVQNISLYNDGGFVTSQSISGCVPAGTVQLTWPTASVSFGNHTLRAVGWDYSSAEDDDTVTVNIQPTHCFNGEMDADETGVDCGGACGLCEGDRCTANEQCASGYCEIPPGETEGVCVDKMKITGVNPLSGAFDTYITISGKFFGQSGGKVYMTAEAGGWVEAPIVSCGSGYDNWTDAQLVISAPKGSTDGPIRVDTGKIIGGDGVEREFTDTTNDDWGPNFIFDVNDLVRPGLCLLDPTTGPPYSTTVELLGKNFGATVDNSANDNVWFGELKSLITTWTDELIRVKVPGLGTGAVAVTAENNGIKGNGLRFYVSEETGIGAPLIHEITPNHGARGEYVTITGENFGDSLGKVILKQRNSNDLSLEGSFDFPKECENSVWTDKQIIFKIPQSVNLNREYSVQVQLPSDPPKLSPIGGYFATESGNPSPGLCRIDPISGLVPFAEGKTMSLYGEYFTDNNVAVPYFWSADALASTTAVTGRVATTEFVSRADKLLVIRPPVGAISGPVVVRRSNDGKISNPLSFSVFDCVKNNNTCATDGFKCCTLGADAGTCIEQDELCSGETLSTGYMWRFSTRDFPLVPRVLENCDADTDLGRNLPSPSPSVQWNAGNDDQTNVCRTALVTVAFTSPVSQNSVNAGSVHVYKCSANESGDNGVEGNQCKYGQTEVTLNAQSYELLDNPDLVHNYFYLSMSPAAGFWDDNSWYHVVLDQEIESETIVEEGNYNLKADRPCGEGTAYCFVFRTDANDCKLKQVIITPFSYWTSILESPVKFRILRNNANDPGSDLYYTAQGLSSQHCILMNTDDYEWEWSAEHENYADIYAVTGDNSNQAQVSAFANTVGVGLSGDSAGITATAIRFGSSHSATSPLTIDLSSPEVVDFWPNCLEACPNAEVGVRFNLAMSNQNISRGIRLYRCNDENCISTTRVAISPTVNPADRREINFTPVDGLDEGVLYQVIINSSSQANRTLWSLGSSVDSSILGKGYYNYFTWRFRVKNEACILDRVTVAPEVYYAPYTTARTVFSAAAYSSPDECRPLGQRLDAWNMQWAWQSTITDVATIKSFSTKGKNTFCTSDCLLKGSDILRGEEFDQPVCGNGALEAGEDCDNPLKDNCALNCLLVNKTNQGSTPITEAQDVNASICGNGMMGVGEDCDLGITADKANTESSMNCSEICLHTGSELSAGWCADNINDFGGFDYADYATACAKSLSQCGDHIAAPNEDPACETGAFDSSVCSDDCLKIKECEPYDEFGRVEGCGLDGKYMGSSLTYSTPSVCGDGHSGNVDGIGEYPSCESGLVTTHTFMDPWVLVIGKGEGVPETEGQPEQRTRIFGKGTQPENGINKTGYGDFVIKCGFTSDEECTQNVSYCGSNGCAVADNSCCYPRPVVVSTYPVSSTPPVSDVCPNTYIEVVFDKKIDPLSLTGNIIVARGSTEDNCVEGEDVTHLAVNDNQIQAPWYKKILYKTIEIAKIIKSKVIDVVFAQRRGGVIDPTVSSWCSGLDSFNSEVFYDSQPADGEEIDTPSHVIIKLQEPLATSSDYAVMLRPGIRDIRGVNIGNKVKWKFVTDNKICLIDSLTVDPVEYLFDQTNEYTNLQAIPKTDDGRLIQPVAGYSWDYLWGPEVNDYVFINTTNDDTIVATTKNRNGEVDMTATVRFTENIFSDKNPTISASSKLTTFICENPWPKRVGNTVTFFQDGQYDFSTFYCRDAGSFGTGDDLPHLNYTVKAAGAGVETGVLRKYLFFTDEVPDAIGISIIANPEKKSVFDLLSQPGFGNYQKLDVLGYDAITDSYNIYVDAVARGSNGQVYSNIYLFSLNQNAGSEMRAIFEQIMENLEFNLFADNIKYCGYSVSSPLYDSTLPCETDLDCINHSTSVCLNVKDKITRNYRRFKDMRVIAQTLDDYKVETGNALYPAMAQNTYLAGQALSVWTNAWNELGSSVGVLPTDPINKLRESGTCYLDPNSACTSDNDCSTFSETSLVSMWPADNTAEDREGRSNGTLVGSVGYTPGKGSGMAFEFGGEAESYVNIVASGTAYSDLNVFTASFWFKPTKKSPALIIKKGGSGDNNSSSSGFEVVYSGQSFANGGNVYDNGTLRFAIYSDSETANYVAVDTASPLELNKWHHIAIARHTNSMSLIVDGQAFLEKRNQNGNVVNTVPATVTNEDFRLGQNLNGALDNIYFFTNAWPTTDIANLRKHLCIFHDPITGWSTEDFRFSFACNTESLAYRYIYEDSGNDFSLKAKMENDGFLAISSFIHQDDPLDRIKFDSYGACISADEISSPSSLICGDGIVGEGEECDPPGTITWDTSACPEGQARKIACNSTCQNGLIAWGRGEDSCRSAAGGSCGDGKIQYIAGEVCDDGELNGQIWRCKEDCSGIENEKCGNGVLDKSAGELCDPSIGKSGKAGWCVGGPYIFDPADPDTTVPCNNNSECQTENCYITGVKYSLDMNESCNWDCKTRGSYCGDGLISEEWNEECETSESCLLADGREGIRQCSACKKDNSGTLDMASLWKFDFISNNGGILDSIGDKSGMCREGECPEIVEGLHKNNPAFDFGTNSSPTTPRLIYIFDADNNDLATPNFSWESWFMPQPNNRPSARMWEKGGSATGDGGIGMEFNRRPSSSDCPKQTWAYGEGCADMENFYDNVRCLTWLSDSNGVSRYSAADSYTVSLNDWHHLVCTFSATNQLVSGVKPGSIGFAGILKIYIDGQLVSTNNSAKISTAAYPLCFGAKCNKDGTVYGTSYKGFKGTVEDVAFYDKEISAEVVSDHYDSNGWYCTPLPGGEGEEDPGSEDYVPYCGNSIVDEDEVCDMGSENGVPCTPPVGSRCSYCSYDCSKVLTVERY